MPAFEQQLLDAINKNNQLLEKLVGKISTAPITSGVIGLEDACNMFGWTYQTGRKKLAYIKENYPGMLSNVNERQGAYYLDELLIVQRELREGKIKIGNYYNKKAA